MFEISRNFVADAYSIVMSSLGFVGNITVIVFLILLRQGQVRMKQQIAKINYTLTKNETLNQVVHQELRGEINHLSKEIEKKN